MTKPRVKICCISSIDEAKMAIDYGYIGFLVLKARYIPKIIGWLLIIAGIGYIVGHLKVFLYPELNTSFTMFTAFGELVFMLWLLIKGSRTKELQIA